MKAVSESDLHRSYVNQSYVRVIVAIFMGFYLLAYGFANHPLYLAFVVFAIVVAFVGHVVGPNRAILWGTIFLDLFFCVAGLSVTGPRGTFLYLLIVQVILGNAIRFGREILWLAVSVASVGLATIWFFDPYWKANSHTLLTFLIGIPIVAVYIDNLVERMRTAEEIAEQRAEDAASLLRFVNHDIRTMLFAIRSTADEGYISSTDSYSAKLFRTVSMTANKTARVASSVLRMSDPNTYSDSDDGSLAKTDLGLWLADALRPFSSALKLSRSKIVVRFNGVSGFDLPVRKDLLDRIVFNLLSNAVRYAVGGKISIVLGNRSDSDCGICLLEITITNTILHTEVGNSRNRPVLGFQNSPEFFGTGIGLEAVRELAKELGGTFESSTANTLYVASLTVPVSGPLRSESIPIQRPVALVTKDRALIREVRNKVRSHAQLFHFPGGSELDLLIDGQHGCSTIVFDRRSQIPCDSSGVPPEQASSLRSFGIVQEAGRETPIGAGSICVEIPPGVATGDLVTALRFLENLPEGQIRNNDRRQAHSGLVGKRILLADDSVSSLFILERILLASGAEIDACSSYMELSAAIATNKYDVFVLDWNFGNQNISELIPDIVQNNKAGTFKIFIYSAESEHILEASENYKWVDAVYDRANSPEYVIGEIEKHMVPVNPLSSVKRQDRDVASNQFLVDLSRLWPGNDEPWIEPDEVALLLKVTEEFERIQAELQELVAKPEETDGLRKRVHRVSGFATMIGANLLAKRSSQFEEALDSALDEITLVRELRELEGLVSTTKSAFDLLLTSFRSCSLEYPSSHS